MSVIAEPIRDVLIDDHLARRNAKVLAVAQALAGGNNTVIVATSSIIGSMLAPDKGLATLPISFMVLGMWMGTLPVGILARRYGRRFALQTGSVFGALSGFVSCAAVLQASFALLLLGALCGGLYAAAHQSYRFAAADTASESFRPKAVSWVLVGGVFAAFLGPQLVIFTKDLWQPYLFAASYVAQSVVAIMAAAVLTLVKIPRPPVRHAAGAAPRPLGEIVGTPRFIVAVVCGVVSYGLMNMVMTSAPLAMIECGHSVTNASLGIQWHVLAMYAPSFVTGSLIARFGVGRIVVLGFVLLMVAAAVAIAGITVAHFWTALVLLGLGWNFSFIGATTLVTHCHRPSERNKVQAFNDFLVFGTMALGSFMSGKMLATVGWAVINEVIFPFVILACGLLLWHSLRERKATV
ncbi:MAG TPA: MFS transporter [Pseudolabrys sp.]|nr:MFS transporter [Pseudolabrys sp.]